MPNSQLYMCYFTTLYISQASCCAKLLKKYNGRLQQDIFIAGSGQLKSWCCWKKIVKLNFREYPMHALKNSFHSFVYCLYMFYHRTQNWQWIYFSWNGKIPGFAILFHTCYVNLIEWMTFFTLFLKLFSLWS